MFVKTTSFKSALASLSVAAVMAFAASSVQAAPTYGSITNVGSNPNSGVFSIYAQNTRGGWYGATLYLIGGPADIDVQLLGYEAGANNDFNFQTASFSGGGGGDTWNPGGIGATQTVLNVASGALDFSFLTDLGGCIVCSVFNVSNPDDSTGGAGVLPNFFATFVPNEAAGGGLIVDLWFDDGGGANDDNHDDLAIRLSISEGRFSTTPVPLPAAVWLFLSALAGLGYLSRRRGRATGPSLAAT